MEQLTNAQREVLIEELLKHQKTELRNTILLMDKSKEDLHDLARMDVQLAGAKIALISEILINNHL